LVTAPKIKKQKKENQDGEKKGVPRSMDQQEEEKRKKIKKKERKEVVARGMRSGE